MARCNSTDITAVLEDEVFVRGEESSDGESSFEAYEADDDSLAIELWTSKDSLMAWRRLHELDFPWFQASTKTVLLGVIATRKIKFIVLNPDHTFPAPGSKEHCVTSFPADRVFSIHDPITLADILCRYTMAEKPLRVREAAWRFLYHIIQEQPHASVTMNMPEKCDQCSEVEWEILGYLRIG